MLLYDCGAGLGLVIQVSLGSISLQNLANFYSLGPGKLKIKYWSNSRARQDLRMLDLNLLLITLM